MTTLHLDLETRSTVDLRETGVHVYAEDMNTQVLCACYAVDGGPVLTWHRDLNDSDIKTTLRGCDEIVAHNAAFERTMLRGYYLHALKWPVPQLARWRCTMAAALAMSLPASLQNAAAAVDIEQGKDMGGRALMLQMSHPRRPRKGENPDDIYWFDDEERLKKLYAYCRQDVTVERELDSRLLRLKESEQQLWQLDQKINDRGVYVDVGLCDAALKVVDSATEWLNNEIQLLTDGAVHATTNVAQIAKWCREQGFKTESLDKDAVETLLARTDLTPVVRRVLEIRREAAKAAVKKIDALVAGRSRDGRARGLLQFHAAGTGRWAGRRFQPQNIKRPELEDIDGAIGAVSTGDAEYVRVTYGDPLSVVGDCLRGLVRAAPGNVLYAADFSNIEGRGQAWLAGEKWKLDAFRAFDAGTGHDIYHITASKTLRRPLGPLDNPGISKAERQSHGKVPELALGYQGGVGAFQKMAVNYGVEVSDERADEIKVEWREAHPNIVQCWYDLEGAATRAIHNRGKTYNVGPIAFRCAGSFLFMRLPSGRCIVYPYPCIKDKLMPWGDMKPSICYQGTDTFTRKWGDQFAHGGLLFNNAVQGLCRDIEAEAIVRVERAGYWNILNVHDEVVCETKADFGSVEEFEALMTVLPEWAAGLPVAASAWRGERYKK